MNKSILLGKTNDVLKCGERIEKYFEQMVLLKSKEIAVWDEDVSYSYEELNNKANGIARALSCLSVKPNDVVAIRFERSVNMIVTILGILKVGATYVPIGLNIPDERVEYILDDCNAKMLLVQEDDMRIESTKEVLVFRNLKYVECSENMTDSLSGFDIAYILYTSGSTGRPKGVKICHNSVINHILWRATYCNATEKDVFILKTPYTFDISVWEMFLWFFVGAKLCVLPEGEERNVDSIVSEIAKHNVSVCQFVPSLLSELLKYIEHRKEEKKIASLRIVFSGGEVLTPILVERFKMILSERYGACLVNVYGPTETTIDSTFFNCNDVTCEKWKSIPLGQPIWNTTICVIDANGVICKEGLEGEIVIAGAGVAQGYVGKVENSNFEKIEGLKDEKIYKTGDIGIISSGYLYFAGRKDNQIKIRGMRVELEEIESRVLSFGNVKKTAVYYDDSHNNGRLYLFYVSDERIDEKEIVNFLKKYLPDYMIPDCFVRVDDLCYTMSGKVDRKQLRRFLQNDSDVKKVESKPKYQLQPKEREVIEVVKESLDIKGDISENASLYEYGINSLAFISLIVDLEDEFDVVFPGEMLMPGHYLTIFDLVKYVVSLIGEGN